MLKALVKKLQAKWQFWRRLGLVVAIAALTFYLGPRFRVDPSIDHVTSLPKTAEIGNWIIKREREIGIRDGLEATVVYAHEDKRKTKTSLIYLHGFSASRRDLEPIPQRVAKRLNANLFLARLSAHGQDADAFKSVTATAWLQDAIDAVKIGERLGDRVVLMGHSTGATLCAWAALGNGRIAAVVLLSPNFGVAKQNAKFALYPWGPQLLRLIAGEYWEIRLHNDLQRNYWTPRYHTNGLGQMLALVDFCKSEVSTGQIACPCLCVYSARDKIVNLGKMREVVGCLQTPFTAIAQLPGSPGHELAGDVLAPVMNQDLERIIADFLERRLPLLDKDNE